VWSAPPILVIHRRFNAALDLSGNAPRLKQLRDVPRFAIHVHHSAMKYLTTEQQKVLCIVLLLLLTGLAVKTWRAAHPRQEAVAIQPAAPVE
jgi:hypothetical protein